MSHNIGNMAKLRESRNDVSQERMAKVEHAYKPKVWRK